MRLRTFFLGLVVFALAQAISAQQPAAPPAVRSPEVLPDHRVTFRLSAPAAKTVSVVCECLTLEQIAALEQEQSQLARSRNATDPDMVRVARAIQATRTNQGERALTKDANGLWSLTVGPLDPDFYEYQSALLNPR